MRATTDAWRAPAARGAYLGVLASLLVHGLGYWFLSWAGSMPTVDFQLALPSHVEFGVTEPIAAAPPPAMPSVPAPAGGPMAAAVGAAPEKPKPKRQHPSPSDAGVRDAEAPVATSRTEAKPAKSTLAAFAPAGAQIALRLQMSRIRDSPLASDVTALLDAVPDWRLIVEGSGLDPLHDLERLYLASPDLQRASVVIAGEYAGNDDLPRRAVASLAAARGVAASFRNYGAIPVAPWANADVTERVVALIAPHQFAITRPDDLPRVLQVARALARRKQKPGGPETDPGEALLALGADQVLAVSVEGARLFARGNLAGVPERFEVAVSAHDETGFDVVIRGDYETPRVAEQAATYWSRTRDRFASHPMLTLIGMREPVTDARFDTDATTLRFSTRMSTQQARVLLGFVQSALQSSTGAPKDSAPTPQRRNPSTEATEIPSLLSPPSP